MVVLTRTGGAGAAVKTWPGASAGRKVRLTQARLRQPVPIGSQRSLNRRPRTAAGIRGTRSYAGCAGIGAHPAQPGGLNRLRSELGKTCPEDERCHGTDIPEGTIR